MSTTTIPGHLTAAEHISTMAAIEAATRATIIEGSDDPRDLLAEIGALNGLADLARWALGDFAGNLSEAGHKALIGIRHSDASDLARVLEDTTTHPDDVAYARRVVAMDDEAIEVADRAKWARGRAAEEQS